MEDFHTRMVHRLGLKPVEVRSYSPVALAYMGDSVYEMVIRTWVMNKGNRAAAKMHKATKDFVNAYTQSDFYYSVQPYLSEEEMDVMRRGRNAKVGRAPKNTKLSTYKHATGFEALIGYLYLENKWDRLLELMDIGMQDYRMKKEGLNGE